MTATTALVRRPGPLLAQGIVTHIKRSPIDDHLALRQWTAYCEALASVGWNVIEVPPADDCPDAVFVEDTVVMYKNVAIVTRPGDDSRSSETIDVAKELESRGYSINRVLAPGTLEGGDVLKVGDVVYVGRSGRTNADGVRQLRSTLTPLGATVVAVPVTKVLHLKTAVTALPDGTIIGYPPSVDDPSLFPQFRAVPEESGAHVVLLGGSKILIAADCRQTVVQMESLGYEPVIVDISEFQKLEGCVTCLSVRLRNAGTA